MTKKLCGTNYPLSICFIVVNEFCERFSYYGMKAVLTLYFMNYLHWDGNLSTAIYHAFGSLCYFTPILGAIIADSWLGKFKTIIYLSLVYVVGHVIKSVGAIPSVGNSTTHIALSMVGLILIALGTGGIKPCVAAFGGDQFSEEHMTERQKFFSIFYMSINAGSVLSTVITPMLRGDVQCFGGDCYALAFGVPAILMIIATVVFVAGSSLYKRNPPQGNIMGKVCKCIGFAIQNRWQNRSHQPARKHWLDWAEEKYSKRLIQEIKMVVRVLVLYIPLPMFWALFDQQGSRWTIQAGRMNMAFGSAFNIKPDQMQMLNALLILLFVPIFDLAVYPLVACCRIKITPLRKMSAGMILAAMAFGAATLVEVNVVKTVVDPAPAQKCLLQVYNMAGGNVTLTFPDGQANPFSSPIGNFEDPEYKTLSLNSANTTVKIQVSYNGHSSQCSPRFLEKSTYSLIVRSTPGIQCSAVEDNIEKDKNGLPLLRFFNTLTETINLTVGDVTYSVHAGEMSLNQTVERGEYPDVSYTLQSGGSANLNLDLLDFGAVYTVILTKEADKIVPHKMEDVKANNVHIGWQIPQYVLLTMGEVLFSITGLEFSYSQAPANMKSVLQAGWLLTVAFGNVIVLIVAEGAGLEQWIEFLLFACLLLGVCVIFSIMAHFYTYVIPEELDKIYLDDSEKEEEDDLKKTSNDIHLNKTGTGTRL